MVGGDEARCFLLHRLESLDVTFLVGIPGAARILQMWPHHCFVRCVLGLLGAAMEISPDQIEVFLSFLHSVVNVVVPG